MANKQSVAKAELQGKRVTRLLKKGAMLSSLRQPKDEKDIDFMQQIFDKGKDILQSLQKTENERMKLQVVSALKGYEQQLNQAKTPEEFASLEEAANLALKATFADEEGKKFWQEYGRGLSEANKRDMIRLREEKIPEFGRISLKKMLADSQNMLAQVRQVNGSDIISRGVNEIKQSPFLNEAEKELYRDDFVSRGILNLSLQNSETAEKLRQEYMPDDTVLADKLAKVKKLQEKSLQEAEAKQKEEAAFHKLQEKTALWQAKKRGEIDDAAYYVLTGDEDAIDETDKKGVLAAAYQLIKKMNSGTELSVKEAEICVKDLTAAVQQKEVDFALAAEMQNLVLNKTALNDSTRLFARRMIDAYADQVLMPDLDRKENNKAGEIFMCEKARLSFELYNAYDAEETALRDEYLATGQKITPAMARKIAREALEKIKSAYGFAMQKDEVLFEELTKIVNENYLGQSKERLWQEFYENAPYAADKKEYLTQLAQRLEQSMKTDRKRGV